MDHNIIVIGAGPAGISLAAESRAAGLDPGTVLLLEKAPEHSFTLKKYYPDGKAVTANYKGFDTVCTGVLCIPDLTKHETISYLDAAILDAGVQVRYSESVHRIVRHDRDLRFRIETDRGTYTARAVVIAIGILGKPNKPSYRIPPGLSKRILYDLTSASVQDSAVLVVGGGDSASEYCQYLVQQRNRVTLSYRQREFTRMNLVNHRSILALAERGEMTILLGSEVSEVRDLAGRPEAVFRDPVHGTRAFDFIVYALGGTTPANFLRAIGVEFEGDRPVVSDGHETSVPGLFLAGDLSAGEKGGSIIWAFNSARTIMQKICKEHLGCTGMSGSGEPLTGEPT